MTACSYHLPAQQYGNPAIAYHHLTPVLAASVILIHACCLIASCFVRADRMLLVLLLCAAAPRVCAILNIF
jgi:hypothetical protein